MAKINITSPGTYEMGDGDTAKIKDPGGDVTLVAPAGDDNVDKIKIEFENNDGIADKVIIDLSTFDEDGLHIDVKEYDASDEIVLLGGSITGVNPDDSDELMFTYVGEDGSTYSGFIHIKDNGENDFTDPDNPIIVCFTTGAMISTGRGIVAVEDLRVGDEVKTRDNGPQKIKWIGTRRLDAYYLAKNPNLWPIRISAGALGNNLPSQDLMVSPQHRMCLEGASAQLLFGCEELFVPAKHLCNDHTIHVARNITSVTYFHILFDTHQVVFSNGAASESLFPGDMALDAMGKSAEAEILQLFPDLDSPRAPQNRTALPVLKAYEARVFQAYGT